MSDLLKYVRENDVVQYGKFTLASGKESDIYFNGKLLTLDSEGIIKYIPDLYSMLRRTPFDAVGGPEIGAIPMVGAMLSYLAFSIGVSKVGFYVRKQPKDHGINTWVEGPVVKGMKVAIIEDTATSGGSAMHAYTRAVAFGLKPVVVGCILNRQEGAEELFKQLGIPFVYLLTMQQLQGDD